jgi:hypothetical protein
MQWILHLSMEWILHLSMEWILHLSMENTVLKRIDPNKINNKKNLIYSEKKNIRKGEQ